MSGSAKSHLCAGYALMREAREARLSLPGTIEDVPVDPALVARALELFRLATDAGRIACSPREEALGWLAQAEAHLALPPAVQTVAAAEEGARQALSLVDSVRDRAETLSAYLTMGRALAQLVTVPDPQQQARIEGAVGILEAGEILALQAGDARGLALVRSSLSRVLGERFRKDRDENLISAVVAGELALPELRAAQGGDSLELPALLHHLGNCCVKIRVGYRGWVGRAREHYAEGGRVVDAARFPRLAALLAESVAMTEALLRQDEKDDALPELEMVARFAAATQEALNGGDAEGAQGHALSFLTWGWSLPRTPNVHVGEAHKLLGKLAMSRGEWASAECHLYESALLLAALLPPEHRWAPRKEEAFELLREAMQKGGRAEVAEALAEQARSGWGALVQALQHADAATGEEALPLLDHALALYPDFPPALLARARQRLERGEPAPALADLQRSLAVRPRDVQALLLRAAVWMSARRHGEALADLNTVLDADAANATALLNRAQLLLREERCEEARRDLDTLLHHAEIPEGYYFRAECRSRLGDAAGAAEDLERLLPSVSDPPLRAEIESRILRLRGKTVP